MSLKLVTPTEAHDQLSKESRAIYLDVRTEQEFAQGHPTGAYNIPVAVSDGLEMSPNDQFVSIVESNFSKDTPILCGCRSGGRSKTAGHLLLAAGFTNVANIIAGYGGGMDPRNGEMIQGWRAAGLPTTNTAENGRDYASLSTTKR